MPSQLSEHNYDVCCTHFFTKKIFRISDLFLVQIKCYERQDHHDVTQSFIEVNWNSSTLASFYNPSGFHWLQPEMAVWLCQKFGLLNRKTRMNQNLSRVMLIESQRVWCQSMRVAEPEGSAVMLQIESQRAWCHSISAPKQGMARRK